ncbi:MAG TPA: D-lysine 5,6-aminomutase subunit alpha, partial [Firmicutes bacterium]|nr:D-lysine 5,6-aminomutase subunit alpha [Bacillota bacterium]
SQFINEQLALAAGLSPWQMGLGHAFEINPDMEDGLLLEIAQAQMARQLFPDAPLKYMPPTKHMTGDIFKGYLHNSLFNLTSVLTGQGIHLLGMLTEAIHTPFIQDRYLAIENARYIMNNARHLREELEIVPDGR